MPIAVVDASAIASVLFGEPGADDVARLLSDRELAAPTLLSYEVANIAAVKIRRGALTLAQTDKALGYLARAGIALYDVAPNVIRDTAIATSLSGYDACYVWLARALGAELVTLDRALDRAFRSRSDLREPAMRR